MRGWLGLRSIFWVVGHHVGHHRIHSIPLMSITEHLEFCLLLRAAKLHVELLDPVLEPHLLGQLGHLLVSNLLLHQMHFLIHRYRYGQVLLVRARASQARP